MIKTQKQQGVFRVSPRQTQTCTIPRLLAPRQFPEDTDLSQYEPVDDRFRAFLNPTGLSYFNLDHILDLNQYFASSQNCPAIISLSQALTPAFPNDSQNIVFRGLFDSSILQLADLHRLNLYEPPFKEGSYRGGRRFLFRSNQLAQQLFNALQTSGLPSKLGQKFVAVNHVFRFNVFEDIDRPFEEHFDIPYIDRFNCRASRYTLLIYLTAGTGGAEALLEFEGERKIGTLREGDCIVMDQKLRHKGRPFDVGTKLFIRTELIYQCDFEKEAEFDPELAAKFSQACYMAKSGITDPALDAYSSECFKSFARARLRLEGCNQKTKGGKRLFLLKKSQLFANLKNLEEVEFMTDGTRYLMAGWVNLRRAVVAVLTDYFFSGERSIILDKFYFSAEDDYLRILSSYLIDRNSNDPEEVYRQRCFSSYPRTKADDHISQLLSCSRPIFGFTGDCTRRYHVVIDPACFCGRKPEEYMQTKLTNKDIRYVNWMCYNSDDEEIYNGSDQDDEDPSETQYFKMSSPNIPKDSLKVIQTEFGETFFRVNFDDMIVQEDDMPEQQPIEFQIGRPFKIYFQTTGSLENWAFASCQCVEMRSYQRTGISSATNYSLPHITATRTKEGLLIMQIDLFHNGYVLKNADKKI